MIPLPAKRSVPLILQPLLSNSCVAPKSLVHPQVLIRQVAAFRFVLVPKMASCRV